MFTRRLSLIMVLGQLLRVDCNLDQQDADLAPPEPSSSSDSEKGKQWYTWNYYYYSMTVPADAAGTIQQDSQAMLDYKPQFLSAQSWALQGQSFALSGVSARTQVARDLQYHVNALKDAKAAKDDGATWPAQVTLVSDASLRRWGSLLAMQGKLMTGAFNQKTYLTKIAAQKAKIDIQKNVLLANMTSDQTGADTSSPSSSAAAPSDTGSADTGSADTDTGSADTGSADTDTGSADSSSQSGSLASRTTKEDGDPNTGSADTGSVDTGSADDAATKALALAQLDLRSAYVEQGIMYAYRGLSHQLTKQAKIGLQKMYWSNVDFVKALDAAKAKANATDSTGVDGQIARLDLQAAQLNLLEYKQTVRSLRAQVAAGIYGVRAWNAKRPSIVASKKLALANIAKYRAMLATKGGTDTQTGDANSVGTAATA